MDCYCLLRFRSKLDNFTVILMISEVNYLEQPWGSEPHRVANRAADLDSDSGPKFDFDFDSDSEQSDSRIGFEAAVQTGSWQTV